MIASTPAAIALINGGNSISSNRLRSCNKVGVCKCESTDVSPCPGKCLAVVSTGYCFAPAINALVVSITSPMVIPKARILITGFSGLLFTSTIGASTQLIPIAKASSAVIRPISSAYGIATSCKAIGGGNHVAPLNRCPTPSSMSAAINNGTRAQDCICSVFKATSAALPPIKITPPTPYSLIRVCNVAIGNSHLGY